MAERADRHDLYQRAVQTVDAEIDFVDETFRALRGRLPRTLREDFCGTANTSCEFVRRRSANRAWGVDLCADTLAWGIEHNLSRLKPSARGRLELVQDDVLKARTPPVDAVLAMNFSYFVFCERERLRAYFRRVRSVLGPRGLFFLDAYGGYDAFRVMKESRDIGRGVTYIWDQSEYEPISGRQVCKIHFGFKDGSRLRDAFTYHWRLWTLPEIREILAEAGFRKSTVYWEGWDDEAWEGTGEFLPTEKGEPDAGWIVYIVGEP
jgi:cyclopropane fatty-acyl-phospholipid synthase-like methyltransferase